MKNLIKSVALIAVMMLAFSSQADYLYFMADDIYSTWDGKWTYAKVKMYDTTSENYETGRTYLMAFDKKNEERFDPNLGMSFYEQYARFDGPGGDNYAFVMELFNDVGEGIARSAVITWQQAVENGSIVSGFGSGHSEAQFNTFLIPEPTSGLMVLFGFSLLALRRKQKLA